MSNTVYEIVTNEIVEQLNNGVVPWRMPWKKFSSGFQNLKSKREYRGINPILLMIHGMKTNTHSPYYLTFNQVQEMGGNVKKDSKSAIVVFWKWHELKKENEKTETVPVLRYYRVFNLDQIEGINAPEIKGLENAASVPPIEKAELIAENYKTRPEIRHTTEGRAYYVPSADYIHMPDKRLFENSEEYYSTLFHELTHSTGHESRLKRRDSEEIRHFGDIEYSREELVAEIGSAFLCAEAGISPAVIKNQAAYIGSWLKALKKDSRAVVMASAQAQKAADYILNRKPEVPS